METRVTFEEDELNRSATLKATQIAGIPGFLINHSFGVIKTPRQANIFMIVATIILVAISNLVLKNDEGGLETYEPPAGYEVITPTNAPPRLERQ